MRIIKGFKSFNESNQPDNIPNDKKAWWEKNNQRLTDFTGNPSAKQLASEYGQVEDWDDMDQENRAYILLDLLSIEELEKNLEAFEEIDD